MVFPCRRWRRSVCKTTLLRSIQSPTLKVYPFLPLCNCSFMKKVQLTDFRPDVFVSGFNFGCGSSASKPQPLSSPRSCLWLSAEALATLSVVTPLTIPYRFSRCLVLIERLRETFANTERKLTRRTGWKFTWNVRLSQVTIQEGEAGPTWTQKVPALPPNLQDIIAEGGLENWVKREIGSV
jgi:homoaconitate hydratase